MADADSKTAEPTYGLTADQVDQAMSDADIVHATLDVAMFALKAHAFIDHYADLEDHVPEQLREELSPLTDQLPLPSLLTILSDAHTRAKRLFDTVGNGAVHLRQDVDTKMQVSLSTGAASGE